MRTGDAVECAQEVGRAEGAVVQAVARGAGLAPDHAPMVGANGASEPALDELAEDGGEIDVTERAGVRRLVEDAGNTIQDIKALYETDAYKQVAGPHWRQLMLPATSRL